MFDDTGLNVPERSETLLAQQQQLIEGRRPAQMFPLNSPELPLPAGCERVTTERGVFHFNPRLTSEDEIRRLSASNRENEVLGLGPYNKADIFNRASTGQAVLVVTERTPDGTEVKAAVGTPNTAPVQIAVLECSKSPGSVIAIERLSGVLAHRIALSNAA